MKTRPAAAPDRRTVLFAAGSTLALAACSGIIGPPAPPALYVLKPAWPAWAAGPKASFALAIGQPQMSDALNTSRIAIRRTDQMDYYADAAWTDTLPQLLQTKLLEGFEASGRIDQVARDSEGLKSDYILECEVLNFEARYDQPDGIPTAVVKIQARLVTNVGREIVARMTVSKEAPASQNSIGAGVDALDQASGPAIAEIVSWAAAFEPASGGTSAPEPAETTKRRRHHRR